MRVLKWVITLNLSLLIIFICTATIWLHSNNALYTMYSPVQSQEVESSDEQTHDSVLYSPVQGQEPPHLASESSEGQTHGYIMNLNYPGQQGSGMRTLVSLQCSMGSFGLPMYIVEPFIVKSTLSSLEGSLRLSDYIDLNHFNTASRGAGYTELAAREDYLHNTPRNVVFLRLQGVCDLPRKSKGETFPRHNIPQVVWSADEQSKCYKHSLPRFHLFSKLLQQDGFCGVRIVRLNHEGGEQLMKCTSTFLENGNQRKLLY